MLHLVGCLNYIYQWCTVKQISDNEIYLLIKYIKSVLWRVVKRLSYIEDARCLKFKLYCRHLDFRDIFANIGFKFLCLLISCIKNMMFTRQNVTLIGYIVRLQGVTFPLGRKQRGVFENRDLKRTFRSKARTVTSSYECCLTLWITSFIWIAYTEDTSCCTKNARQVVLLRKKKTG